MALSSLEEAYDLYPRRNDASKDGFSLVQGTFKMQMSQLFSYSKDP